MAIAVCLLPSAFCLSLTMAYSDLGTIYPPLKTWRRYDQGFSTQLNLFKISYSNYFPEINESYFFLRLFYPFLNAYDRDWHKIYPKLETELIYLPNKDTSNQIAFVEISKYKYRFKGGSSNVAVNLQVNNEVFVNNDSQVLTDTIVQQNKELKDLITGSSDARILF